MSDNLTAGLDISGFSDDKKRRLEDFIALFERLERFEGKKFAPVSGDGMIAFNSSAKETNTILEQINFKLATLNSNVDTFVNSGVASTRKLKKSLDDTNLSLGEMGRYLTRGLGYLRTLAYILPGIGLAGIFNLAGEAIAKAASSVGLFNTRLEDTIKFEAAENKTLLEKIKLYEKLYNLRKGLSDIDDVVETEGRKTEVNSKKGTPKDVLLQQQIDDAKLNAQKAEAQLVTSGFPPEILQKDLDRRLDIMQGYAKAIIGLQDKIDKTENPNLNKTQRFDSNGKKIKGPLGVTPSLNSKADIDLTKIQKKSLEDQLEIQTEAYNKDKKLLDDYLKYTRLAEDKSAELDKFKDDENRKLFVKTETEKLKTSIAINEVILKDQSSSDQKKIDAVKKLYDENSGIIALDYFNIDKDRTTTDKQRLEAQSTRDESLKRLQVKRNEELFNLTETFYQRDKNANAETEENKQDDIAVANEKIFQNTKNSLQERLDAYKAYIEARDRIADIVYKKNTDVLGLSDPQKEKLGSDRDRAKDNNKANSEKTIYDIIYSDAQSKLKDVIDSNILQQEENKKAYGEELTELNNSFQNKEISFKEFQGRTKALGQKYKIEEEQQNIVNDSQELKRLDDLLKDQKELRDKYASEANIEKDPKKKANLEAQYDAEVDAIANTEKEQKIANDRLSKDTLDAAKALNAKELEGQKQLADNKKKIAEDSFKLAEKLTNQSYENQIRKIELIQQAEDEQFDLRTQAVERSSIDLVNKNALEIQIAEQKREADKATAVQERKIKYDQAVADRALSAVHVGWNTIEAAIGALAYYKGSPIGFEIAASIGVLGALEEAQILATDIPAYKLGTRGNKHPGGLAETGEGDIPEVIKEPYKSPYFVTKHNISYLPKGTEVFPINDIGITEREVNSGWDQTLFLASKLDKMKPKQGKIHNTIIVNINDSYRKKILGN